MACVAIQENLVAEEALSEDERAHLRACPACQAFAATLGDIARAGASLAAFGPAPAADVAEVCERVQARLAPAALARRLAFALPALALGVIGVVAMLTVGGWPDATRTGASVFALMDEVDDIAIDQERVAVVVGPSQSADDDSQVEAPEAISLLDEVDEITAEADDEVGLLTDLFGDPSGQAQDEESWELTLPDGYQLLDDVLEERWL